MSQGFDLTVIELGTPVVGYDDQPLGEVLEVRTHLLLVGSPGATAEFEVPAQSILEVSPARIKVHVTRQSSSLIDDAETARNLVEDQ